MKWSLHPVVGPRLKSGQPLIDPEELPAEWRELWDSAQAWSMPGVDHTWEVRSGTPKACQALPTRACSRPEVPLLVLAPPATKEALP
jgi:hypothetical protein